ncbi:MAG TPA: flavodoxin [Acidimicrobiales bacterium]|nr:flavodoxin [Acidimicrobiales bacterium]
MAKQLLIVSHSRSGNTARLAEAVVGAAGEVGGTGVEVRALSPFEAEADDVASAQGIVLGTPANFGYMSGALKDFFERIYHPCLDRTVGLPYCLFVKGDTDADGAVTSVQRIVAGLRWHQVLAPLVVVGPLTEDDLARAAEMGATMAAGLEADIF